MTEQKVGRLALRVEGDWWEAYYAMPSTMEGAIPLGRIKMSIATKNKKYKMAFQDLMWEVVADFLEDATGTRPTRIVEPAAESERAGHA